MAITNLIPEIWSARLLDAWQREAVWQPLVRDFSAEVAAGGDKVHLGALSSSITVGDYTRGSDITYQTLTTTDTELNLDKEKYWAVSFDDLDAAQVRPDVIDAAMTDAALQTQIQVNDDIRAAVDAVIDAGSTLTAAWPDPLTDAFRTATIRAILGVAKHASTHHWPRAGRYMVCNAEVENLILDYLSIQTEIGTGQLGDAAFRNIDPSTPWGFQLIVDAGIPTTGANGNEIYFGVARSDAIAFAGQVDQVEGLRHPNQFADLLRGLFNYGVKGTNPDRLYVMKWTGL